MMNRGEIFFHIAPWDPKEKYAGADFQIIRDNLVETILLLFVFELFSAVIAAFLPEDLLKL